MRPIAIMGAMQEELAGLKPYIQGGQTVTVGTREITSGTWHGHSVVLVLSRIGKVAAATTATALIERFDVKEIVFTGVAGGLSPNVGVGDMVVATEFIQHDMDASPFVSCFGSALVWPSPLSNGHQYAPEFANGCRGYFEKPCAVDRFGYFAGLACARTPSAFRLGAQWRPFCVYFSGEQSLAAAPAYGTGGGNGGCGRGPGVS